jgi:hypothetical protein
MFPKSAALKTTLIGLGSLLAAGSTFAETFIPTAPGTAWKYTLTEELGEDMRFSALPPDGDGKLRAPAMYRLAGTQELDGKNLLRFDMIRDGKTINTDLLAVDDQGIACSAKIDQKGAVTKLDPPQIMVAAPIKVGATWDFDTEVGGARVRQHYRVINQEDINLPAGKFRAFKIHGEQKEPEKMIIDRWFVKGVGIVKDVTTTRALNNDLVRRITLELKERPKIVSEAEVNATGSEKKFSATIARDADGEGVTQISSSAEKVYARWRGHDLRPEAKIRIVFIGENLDQDAPGDLTVDQAETTAMSADSHGAFTLSRPDQGWVPGNYRVEFFVDDTPAETVKLKISE